MGTRRAHHATPLYPQKFADQRRSSAGIVRFRTRGHGVSYRVGVEPSPLLLRPFIGLLYQPWMMTDGDDCGAISGMNG
jgi:hypothetical protein